MEFHPVGTRADKADETLFSILESDIADVEIITDFDEGKVEALGWTVFGFETPEDLRERIAFNLEEIRACEAVARFKEGLIPAPTEQQDSVADTIYGKPYNALADYAKNVVNRVVDNYYGKDN